MEMKTYEKANEIKRKIVTLENWIERIEDSEVNMGMEALDDDYPELAKSVKDLVIEGLRKALGKLQGDFSAL